MNTLKKALMGLAALAALALGGAAIAGATGSGNGNGDGEKADDGPDAALTGAAAKRAGTAAVKAVGGGNVVSVERSDESAPAYFEVKVDKGATVTEVQLDEAGTVTSQKADDDPADKGDGDGETADDAAGHHDAGDGDGEDPSK